MAASGSTVLAAVELGPRLGVSDRAPPSLTTAAANSTSPRPAPAASPCLPSTLGVSPDWIHPLKSTMLRATTGLLFEGMAASDENLKLMHPVSCNAEAFASLLYPVLASNFDVMVLVNLGQGKFQYAPANARRTANPCFVRAASAVDARGGGSIMGLDFDDSGELFSMGRVDSGWLLETRKVSKSRKESIGGSGAAASVSTDTVAKMQSREPTTRAARPRPQQLEELQSQQGRGTA